MDMETETAGAADLRAVAEAMESCGVDPGDLRYMEVDAGERTLSGYGYDCADLPAHAADALPDGWGVWHVYESDGATLHVGSEPAGDASFRMDLVAGPAMAGAIGCGLLDHVDGDDWGFTDERDLAGDLRHASATPPDDLSVAYETGMGRAR